MQFPLLCLPSHHLPSTIHLAAGAFTGFVLAVPPSRAALAFAAIACIFSTFAARALAFLTLASRAADMSFPFAIACARGFSVNERGLNEQKRDRTDRLGLSVVLGT